MRELVLYATGRHLDGLPPELFFDDDIVWHQRQLGLPGQIATADVVVSGQRRSGRWRTSPTSSSASGGAAS